LVPGALLAAEGSKHTKNKLTDTGITSAVENDLLIDPGVSSHLIDVKTTEGVVTLSGSVDNLLSKERAIRIAKSIRGVRAIVDQMTLKTVSRTDEQIQSDIENALLRDPAADSYEVKVKVKDGVATLQGQVQSWQERQLSGEVARGVRGVRSVKNEISWKWAQDRSDSEIRADIRRRLQSDVWVDARQITVDVTGGKVKLVGAVGSAIEKSYAFSAAWVAGVKEVNDSGLNVNPWLRHEERRASRMPPSKSDDAIAKAVKDAFKYDPRVYSFNTTVGVENGVVTLTGVVDNLKAKRAAGRDAGNTLGVRRVVNLLKVRQASPPADEEIAKKIREALAASPFVDRFDVVVRVVNQEAYLSGLADSRFEKAEAARVAEGVEGVVEVRNNLNLRNSGYFAPSWNYYSYYNRPLTIGPVASLFDDDWRIKEEIESQLFWSPLVDTDEVSVTVKDGVATVSGTVNSRMERGAAIDNAYQGGALAVKNKLKLNGAPGD
jgi:osmotically-inducible protein OsmY